MEKFHTHQKIMSWEYLLYLDGRERTKKKKFGYFQELIRSFWVLCLQVLNSSFLLFKEAESGLKMMQQISLRHNLHFLLTGLCVGALSSISHSIWYCLPSSFSFQMWVLSLVLCLLFSFRKSSLCLYHLFLNVFPVSPV